MNTAKYLWMSIDLRRGRHNSVTGRLLRLSPSRSQITARFPSYPRTDGSSPSRLILREPGRTGRLRTLTIPEEIEPITGTTMYIRMNLSQKRLSRMRKAREKTVRETMTARKTPGRKIIVRDSAMSCPDGTDLATPSPDDPSLR